MERSYHSTWNVVVTLLPEGFRDATRILPRFGQVWRTAYWDVLVMRTEQPAREFLEAVRELLVRDATLANAVARLVPVTETFTYTTPEAFRTNARAVVTAWATDLEGKRFYVRMHRRGFKGVISSHDEECALGDYVLARLQREGSTAHVSFDDPDWVIAIETVDDRAGLSRWARDDFERYELLRLD